MNTRYLVTGIILVAGLVGGIFWLKQRNPLPSPQTSGASAGAKEKTKGPLDASLRIVEYSDFQCPACQKSQETLRQILERLPGSASLTFRHFPLGAAHPNSPLAHQAAECAHEQRKFWEYHDRLFAEQMKWAFASNFSEILLGYAYELGLNLDAFARCLTDEKIRRRVLAERNQGERLQIKSTPTFFVNDERVVGLIELQRRISTLTGQSFSPPPSENVPPPSASARSASGK